MVSILLQKNHIVIEKQKKRTDPSKKSGKANIFWRKCGKEHGRSDRYRKT
jgi:hypothetical protein